MPESAGVSTPVFGPEMLGPATRPDDQPPWDPAHQAMDQAERWMLREARSALVYKATRVVDPG